MFHRDQYRPFREALDSADLEIDPADRPEQPVIDGGPRIHRAPKIAARQDEHRQADDHVSDRVEVEAAVQQKNPEHVDEARIHGGQDCLRRSPPAKLAGLKRTRAKVARYLTYSTASRRTVAVSDHQGSS